METPGRLALRITFPSSAVIGLKWDFRLRLAAEGEGGQKAEEDLLRTMSVARLKNDVSYLASVG
jgi:hypothetical protein